MNITMRFRNEIEIELDASFTFNNSDKYLALHCFQVRHVFKSFQCV